MAVLLVKTRLSLAVYLHMWIIKNVSRQTWTECFCHCQFSEIRDKYALAQKEIAQLNTELQDGTYELQKANHRVDNLVKRLNELEDMNKRLREGNTAPGEPGESEPAQVIMAANWYSYEFYFTSISSHIGDRKKIPILITSLVRTGTLRKITPCTILYNLSNKN